MNNRRKIILALGASAFAAPLSTYAQTKVWRVGYLLEYDAPVRNIDAFKAGLRELGYVEGRDYAIELHSAKADIARLPALAAELIALKVDVILVGGTPSAMAARNATREIPLLITTVGDPVRTGLAAALSRPGGNVTGLTALVTDLYTKRLDLLRQMLPGMRRVGFLHDPDNAASALGFTQFEADCGKFGFKSLRAPVRKAADIAAAFNTLKRDKAQGLIVASSGTNMASREDIVELAARHRLPTVYSAGLFAEAGGLLSYAPNEADLYRRVAAYADKIFKGAKPGDLPIEQPTKFELVVNMKTAKVLGIKIPGSVLVQATRVIE
jgi:putative ABC transport system substrate-binding protein